METKFAKNAYRSFLFWGVCSSLGVAISTIVDAVLVGNFVGEKGLAVANIATPVFLTYALFGVTLGIGANVLVGKLLGENRLEDANKLFGIQVFWSLTLGVLIMAVTLVFQDFFLHFLGAGGELLPLAKQYLLPTFASAPFFVLYQSLAVSVRTDSDPKTTTAAAVTVIVVNLGLDLFFMKGLGWGILGASFSLCIAEFLGLLVLLTHFGRKNALLKFSIFTLKPKLSALWQFTMNGFGIGSFQLFQAIVMLVFNLLLLRTGMAGVVYVAVFGVLYTCSTIPLAVFDGSANAIGTVVSILAGEKQIDSMRAVLRQGILTALVFGTGIALLFSVFAKPIALFFGLEGVAVQEAVFAIRIFSVSFLVTGINTAVTAFWQTIGRAKLAGVFSLVRNLVLMLIFGSLLISGFGLFGLCLTYSVSELVCLIVAIVINCSKRSSEYVKNKYAIEGKVFEKYYGIREESVTEIAQDLETVCETWKIPMKTAFFIHLITEELLLNIIKFGLKDKARSKYISIRLLEQENGYVLRIRDNVASYNPFESEGDDLDMAVMRMIHAKSKKCEYQRKLIFNYLYIEM